MKTKLISIVLFLVLVCSCRRTLPDEEFTMERTPYTGKEIRLDGCYISNPDERHKYCEYDFFYSNGVFFGFGDFLNISNITQFTEIDSKRQKKGYWGIYQVKNNSIILQTWTMRDVDTQFIVQNRSYKIINDSLLFCDILNDGDINYFHFQKFTPKPDSTNVFIK